MGLKSCLLRLFCQKVTFCFGCGSLYILKDSSTWTCNDCGTINKYDRKTNHSYPKIHDCINTDYCDFCVSNNRKTLKYTRKRQINSKTFSDFCSTCLHNQKVVITLLSNDPPKNSSYRLFKQKILQRHPIVCQACSLKVNMHLDKLNINFKKEALNSRLHFSKTQAHNTARHPLITYLKSACARLSGWIFFLSLILKLLIRITFIAFHAMGIIYPISKPCIISKFCRYQKNKYLIYFYWISLVIFSFQRFIFYIQLKLGEQHMIKSNNLNFENFIKNIEIPVLGLAGEVLITTNLLSPQIKILINLIFASWIIKV
jgi:hypothetical protein